MDIASGRGVFHSGGESRVEGYLIDSRDATGITNFPIQVAGAGLTLKNISVKSTANATNAIGAYSAQTVGIDGFISLDRTNSPNVTLAGTSTNYTGTIDIRGNVLLPTLSTNTILWLAPGGIIRTGIVSTGLAFDGATGTLTATGSGDLRGVVNAFTNPAAGIVGMVQHSNTANANIKGLVAGSNIGLTDNGTNVSLAVSASGNSGAVQFNQGAVIAGTNSFIFDRTNHIVYLAERSSSFDSGFRIDGGGGSLTNSLSAQGFASYSGVVNIYPHKFVGSLLPRYILDTNVFWATNAVTKYLASGLRDSPWSTNWNVWVEATNIAIRGGSPGSGKVLTSDAIGVGTWQSAGAASTNLLAASIGQLTTTNGTYEVPLSLFQIGTNLLTGTNMSGRYVAALRSSGPTNLAIYPGAAITRLELWTTNGTTVNLLVDTNGSGFPASWYIGGSAVAIATNGLTLVDIWTNSLGTNVWVRGPEMGLGVASAGGNGFLAMTTNYAGALAAISNTYIPQVSSMVLSNLVGTVGNNVTNESSSQLQITSGTLGIASGSALDNIVSQGNFDSPGVVSNVANIMFAGYTNYSATVSNFVFSFRTNTYELVVATNLNLTNIVGHSRAPTATDMKILIRPINQNLVVVWPAAGVNHASYNWRTNASSTLWTTLTNNKVYVASMSSIGTNVFPTITLWE